MNISRILAVLILIVTFLLLFKGILLDFYPDFTNYYYGPSVYLQGANPYLGSKELFTSFVYHPFLLLFFVPLSLFPFIFAEKVWFIASIILLLASLYYLFKTFKQPLFTTGNMLVISLVFISFPVKFSFGMGQINVIILFLLVLFLYFYMQQKKYISGVFLGTAFILKLFPLVILPYLIVRKQYKILFASILVFVVAVIISLFVIRNDVNQYYYHSIVPTLITSWKEDYYNQALSGFLTRMITDEGERNNLKIFLSTVIVGSTFLAIVRNKKKFPALEIAAIITTSVLINTFSWQHHFIWLVIPFLIIYFHLKQTKKAKKYFIILFVAYCLVSFNIPIPTKQPVWLLSHVFYGGILVWVLNMYLLLKQND